MQTQPLTLTMDQALVLTDRTRNDATDEGRQIGKPLLLKLGAAYMDLVGDSVTTSTVTIWVTEAEAWYLRTLVNSGDRTDRDSRLGIHTLRQLYQILLAFDTADATGPVADAESGDLTMAEAQKRLTQRVTDTSCGGA